jgi:hypothetical protein
MPSQFQPVYPHPVVQQQAAAQNQGNAGPALSKGILGLIQAIQKQKAQAALLNGPNDPDPDPVPVTSSPGSYY